MRAVLLGLLLAAVLGVIGAVAGRGGPTSYTSRTVMLIDDPYGLAVAGNYTTFLQLDSLRFKYADLVDTTLIAQPVANELHLSFNDVAEAASTFLPTQSLLMNVDATWSSPKEAQVISEAVATELSNYVKREVATYNIPPPSAFTLSVIDPASAAVSHGPSSRKALTLAIGLAILGFVLGFLGAQLARYLR